MESASYLLLCLCLFACVHTVVPGKSDPCNLNQEDQLRFSPFTIRPNATCGFDTGEVEICSSESWRPICNYKWTVKDAQVVCRQLNRSSLGVELTRVNIITDNSVHFFPECAGTENTITSCENNVINRTLSQCSSHQTVVCFQDDSAVDICFDTTAATATPTDGLEPTATTSSTATTSNTATSSNTATGQPPQATPTSEQTTEIPEFLKSPVGITVIIVIVGIVVMVSLLLVIILVLVCRRSPGRERTKARVSPQSLEDSFKDSSDEKPGVFSSSPSQNRRTTEDAEYPDHHYIEQAPLYERVKDVAPTSVSSHDSDRSTATSETNVPTATYSTLERAQEMPTYSTLERSQSEYAQVQPFITESLTRGATLQTPTTEDDYHVLDRSNSQSSFKRTHPTSLSPKSRSKSNTSPKTTRVCLPSITDGPEEIPDYAELDTPVEGHRDLSKMVSNSTVVSQGQSPELPPRPNRQLFHANGTSGRPATHERVSPKNRKKSSTLPNTGRTPPSAPPSQRLSVALDSSNSSTILKEGRLTSSNPNSSWRFCGCYVSGHVARVRSYPKHCF